MPKRTAEGALYVRLPAAAVDKLDRAAEALGIHKKDLIAGLVTKYVDPDSRRGLSELTAVVAPKRTALSGATRGAYSFQAYDPPEVLTLDQTADLLQLDNKTVHELAEAGKLPGRKVGYEWRFSRTALITWLSGTEKL